MNERKKVIVLGVLGVNVRAVRNKIMAHGYGHGQDRMD
jgi:hypothetical protein